MLYLHTKEVHTLSSRKFILHVIRTHDVEHSIYSLKMHRALTRTAVRATYLVSAQHDRDVLAHPSQVSVPVGHILVCDTASHVEHDDRTLPLDAARHGMEHDRTMIPYNNLATQGTCIPSVSHKHEQ